jgi:hypothetical protein
VVVLLSVYCIASIYYVWKVTSWNLKFNIYFSLIFVIFMYKKTLLLLDAKCAVDQGFQNNTIFGQYHSFNGLTLHLMMFVANKVIYLISSTADALLATPKQRSAHVCTNTCWVILWLYTYLCSDKIVATMELMQHSSNKPYGHDRSVGKNAF